MERCQIRKTRESLTSDEKAKNFLHDVIGTDLFNKLTKEGKIEVNSGKYHYELSIDGVVLN